MRGNWWKIARLELTLAMRDRESLIWSLVAPIAMAWLFGSMFGADGPPAPTRVTIDVGQNPKEMGEAAESYMKLRGFDIADDGIRVVLPDSIYERMSSNQPVNVRVIQGDAENMRVQSVSAAARTFIYVLAVRPRLDRENTGSGLSESPFVHLQTETLGSAPKIASGKERTLPSMLIMYIMFQVMTFFLSLWVDDLRTGKIKRIVMSPSTPGDLLLGEIAARLIWAGLQVVVILGVGSLLLGVHLNVNWLHFGLVILAFMLAAASIGMMAASFFRSSEKAGAIGVVISLVLAALGGCWWPLEIVPAGMRAVALALPTGQAMRAIGEMLNSGPAAPFPFTAIIILLIMAGVAMAVASRRMRAQLVT